MFNNIIGIISAPETSIKLGELTNKRPFSTVPIASRYRIHDFALSNLAKSGIDDVVYCTETPQSSLLHHLKSGKPWNMSRKNGGLLLNFRSSNSQAASNELQQLFQLSQGETYFDSKTYVVINTSIHNIYAADYKDLILLAQGDDVDLVGYYKVASAKDAKLMGTPTFTLDGNRINYLSQLASSRDEKVAIDLGIYVMRVGFFKKVIAEAINNTNATTLWQALQMLGGEYNFLGQEHSGYVGIIRDLPSYYNVQKEIVTSAVQKDLFYRLGQMATNSYDEAPTYYHENAKVEQSLLATGCRVYGSVNNSVIARRVMIGKNSVIENCVIMNHVIIGENVRLKNMIIDKETKISDNTELSGTEQVPYVIPQKLEV